LKNGIAGDVMRSAARGAIPGERCNGFNLTDPGNCSLHIRVFLKIGQADRSPKFQSNMLDLLRGLLNTGRKMRRYNSEFSVLVKTGLLPEIHKLPSLIFIVDFKWEE
jgi:hypothetical protein